jgi:hypothetical protein
VKHSLILFRSVGLESTQFAKKEVCIMPSAAGPASRVLAALIAGAAMTGAADAAPPSGDACSLLTTAQVSAALGVPVGDGTYITPTFKKTCTWTATMNGGGTVTLNLQSIDQYDGGRKLASYGKSVSFTSITGIGDDAYYFSTDKLVGLIAKKGDTAFKIAVYAHLPIERQQAVEKALALQVIALL